MKEFKKIYDKRYTEKEDGKEEEPYSNYKSMDEYIFNESHISNISLPKELNEFNPKESHSINQANTEEIIFESDTDKIGSIKENNQRNCMIQTKSVYGPGEHRFTTTKKANTDTKDKTNKKKKVPQTQDSTEKVSHTKYAPDNNRCKVVTSFMENVFNTAQKRCEINGLKLNKNDIKKNQFGWNIIHFNNFISAKIYQILGYQDEHNKEVIKKMCEEIEDEVFIFLMSCTFEYQYNKYINGDNIIHLDESQISLTPFEEVIKEKKIKLINKKIKKKGGQPLIKEELDDIEKEINDFREYSKNFLKDIKGEGKLKKRKPENLSLCTYEKIDLFEDYYKSKIMNA